jgi:hypothetical protein
MAGPAACVLAAYLAGSDADIAMYRAKPAGGGRLVTFCQLMGSRGLGETRPRDGLEAPTATTRWPSPAEDARLSGCALRSLKRRNAWVVSPRV